MTVDESGGVLAAELDRERAVLRRLERIRLVAVDEGAYGTPALDRDIAETRAAIAALEARPELGGRSTGTGSTGPIPPVDDEYPDSDGSDDGELGGRS